MYELFKSNEQDESLLLLAENMDRKEAMIALKECNEPYCQVELFTHGKYYLIATKHHGKITKLY